MRFRGTSTIRDRWIRPVVTVTAAALIVVSLARLSPAPAAPGGSVDTESSRGLVLRLSSLEETGAAVQDARRSRLLALEVPAGEPVSPFVPAGPFRATFEGLLEIDFTDDYTFSLEGNGSATLRIDGRAVLSGDGDLSAVKASTVELDSGARRIALQYESPRQGDARVRLFWSSFDFGREPVPPWLLSHDPDHALLVRRIAVRGGRELFAQSRCLACHSHGGGKHAMPELNDRAPPLDDVGKRLRPHWLARWIDDPQSLRPWTSMPRLFGDESSRTVDRRALDITAFLASAGPDSSTGGSPVNEASIERGEQFFDELGCIACHVTGGASSSADEFARISLRDVRAKWKRGALAEFLRAPHRYHPSGRMPDLQLSESEARDLASFVRARGEEVEPVDLSRGDAARGRKLVRTAGCLACHELQGVDAAAVVAPDLAKVLDGTATTGCLAADVTPDRAPDFAFDAADLGALRAFLTDGVASLGRVDPQEYAGRQFARMRCGACHERDGKLDDWSRIEAATADPSAPFDPTTAGELLQVRPDLTWVGAKIRPSWLAGFLAGHEPHRLRPWLAARMPNFALHAELMARGLVLEHAPGEDTQAHEATADSLEVAAHLVSNQGGFACVTCHSIGPDRVPAGFDARGLDLITARSRMRHDFWLRWLRSPQRVRPGTKMPQFAPDGMSPYPDLLGGDATQQFDAIWNYLERVDQPEFSESK